MAPKTNPVPAQSDWLSTPASAWLAAFLIALAGFAAYANSLGAPFVFDDQPSIVENRSIRALATAWHPPSGVGETVGGRPVLNLSFALNYAAGGLDVRGYHEVNLLIHVATGLLLFALVHRTLRCPALRARWGDAAWPVALATTLWWLLHPLQTESVTYVVQRAESLAGFFCLFTLYAFKRGATSLRPAGWQAASVAACLLGMATKETAAVAPLLVLLFDRTFVSGTFAAALRARRSYYAALAATWLLLGWLVWSAGGRGATAGLTAGITPWTYALTQCRAVVLYLRLAVWPAPLVFDYGTGVAEGLAEVWPQAVVLLLLATVTGLALWRKPELGFLGAWFFLLLAPSSSVVPVATQTMAEHRVYLALAAPVLAAVLGLHALLGQRSVVPLLAITLLLAWATVRRNATYCTEESLWRDTLLARPEGPRAHVNLGAILAETGRPEEAISHYEQAARCGGYTTELRNNLGTAYAQVGRTDEAISQFEGALQLTASSAKAHYNLGTLLAQRGRLPEAAGHLESALRVEPANAGAHGNLGNVYYQLGRLAEARAQYEEALRLDPEQRVARAGLVRLGGPAGR